MLDVYKVLMLAIINSDFNSIALTWDLKREYLYDDKMYDFITDFKSVNHIF